MLPQIVTWACIGISIAGYVSISGNDDPLAPTPFSQSGTAITTLLFAFEVAMFLYMFLIPHNGRRGLDMVPPEEAPQFHCLVLCLPLLGLRLLYALLYTVTEDDTYSPISGSPVVYLIFTTLPEIAIIASCIWAVLHIRVIGKDEMAGRGFFRTIGRLTERRSRNKSPTGDSGRASTDD